MMVLLFIWSPYSSQYQMSDLFFFWYISFKSAGYVAFGRVSNDDVELAVARSYSDAASHFGALLPHHLREFACFLVL